MFRAVDSLTCNEVSSLDVDPTAPPVGHRDEGDTRPHDPLELRLREWSGTGRLVCIGCRAAVMLRRGWLRVAHFAHPASEQSCRHARATEAESNAAVAALYLWMREKCGRADGSLHGHEVAVEHWPDDVSARHPIDLYVTGPGKTLGYVLLDRRLQRGDRDAFDRFAAGVTHLWPIGLGRRFRLRRANVELARDDYPDAAEVVEVELQPQEQWAARHSRHAMPAHASPADAALRPIEHTSGASTLVGGATHFLIPTSDPPRSTPEHWHVVTIRLSRPRVGRYERAAVLRSPLAVVLVDPRDGGFVHPGEHERLREWNRAVEAERRALTERRERGRAIASYSPPPRPRVPIRPPMPNHDEPVAEPPRFDSQPKLGTCVYCGRATRDWWCFFGATGTCKCNACRNQADQPGPTSTSF